MMAYERHLREVQRLHPTTIRRRLSALSSLFRHLVQFEVITIASANGSKLENIQRPVGYADASTTQLYDQGRFTPQKSAALAVEY
jgi:site-specific recombinase XerD